MIRRLAVGLLLLPLLLVLGCQSELPEGAIAQVGTALVSQSQFDDLKAAYEAAGRAPDESKQPEEYRKFEQALAEYLVILEVLRQEAATFKVSVTDRDVEDELAKIRAMFQGDQLRFEDALESQDLTLDRLTRSIRETLWLDRMRAAVTEEVTVTEQEVQAYYDAHKSEYIEQEARAVRHILISPFKTLAGGAVSSTASEGEWQAAKSEAEKVRTDIQNGADFITQVEKYSDDTATNESGGRLGEIIRGQMVPALEEAVFSLRKGDLSEPVRTQFGYHIIHVTDITPERQIAYDQVKEGIRTTLLNQKQTETWERWLAQKQAELGVAYLEGYAPASAAGRQPGGLSTTTTR